MGGVLPLARWPHDCDSAFHATDPAVPEDRTVSVERGDGWSTLTFNDVLIPRDIHGSILYT